MDRTLSTLALCVVRPLASRKISEMDFMNAGRMDWKLLAILAVFLVVEAVLLLAPGRLAISGHEVDVLHATEAAMRLSMGQMQHVDFMTPLGILAFKPIAFFLDLGLGISTANIAGNILIGLCFLPFLIWVGIRRLGDGLAVWFGILSLVMITAVVYGGEQATVSMSMHYNRWGWAAAFVLSMLILLPEQGEVSRPRIDGIVIGAMLGFLLLLKVTFFMVLAPVVALVFLIDRDWQRLIATGLAGLVICLLATLLFGGIEFWQSYLSDLIAVSQTESRPRPGKEFRDGLVLFLLAPAFIYITYQNWGNDTKWLVPLSFACFVWSRRMAGARVYGWDGGTYFLALGFISISIIIPSFVNMTTSPIRNLAASSEGYIPVMLDPKHAGLVIERKRSYMPEAMVAIEGVRDEAADPDDEMTKSRLRLWMSLIRWP